MAEKISALFDIRAGEGRTVSLFIGIMLLCAAGYSLGGTGIEALYFARFGTDLLPYLYVGLGILSFITSLAITGLLGRARREYVYIFIPLTATVLILLAWGLLFSKSKFIYPALWLSKEVLNTFISMTAWNTASAICDTRQAKRLFPIFNGARIFGSVIGGIGTGILVSSIGTQNLVLIWAACMGAVFVMVRILMQGKNISGQSKQSSRVKRRKPSFVAEMQKGWQYVRRSALMQWVSFAAILFSVLYFSIALPFSKSATIQYPNENDLATFLGLFNALSTAAAFIASIFLANRLYARFGIMNIILALPLIYFFGFGSLVFLNIFAVIVAFRFAQMLWLSGMADAAWQTMFSVIPSQRRDQVNAFINGVPEQAGVFLAGGILIIGEQAFTAQQLYIIGLGAAVLTTFLIWRASSAYRQALVSSLREGRPTIFSGRATTFDSTSLNVALESLKNPDPIIRRVAAETLGDMNMPKALVPALQDKDWEVQIAALKGLTHHLPALLEVSTLLSDPEPAVRQQAIRTLSELSPYSHGLSTLLEPMLKDDNVHVQLEAALGILKIKEQSEARRIIRDTNSSGNLDERIHALKAISELNDSEAYHVIMHEIQDPAPAIRRAAALALAACGNMAIPPLIQSLADEDSSVRDGVAQALAKFGEGSIPQIIAALKDRTCAEGALITLGYMPVPNKYAVELRDFANKRIVSALRYSELASSIGRGNEPLALLSDSLSAYSRRDGIQALRALSLLNDQESIQVAIENLQSKEAAQSANALETLESVHDAKQIKPLLRLWEAGMGSTSLTNPGDTQRALKELLTEADDWLRACAVFAAQNLNFEKPILIDLAQNDPSQFIREIASQGENMEPRNTLPMMERVLFLRRVPLLSDLSPADLQRVAALVTEHHAEPSEVICEQGDSGEEMYVIVHGEVRVMVSQNGQPEKEFARRRTGEVIGEMSVISGEPRIATIIAAEKAHFLCLDKKSFEGLLRERPEVSLAIMRVLCTRLKEATK